jgi:hypothetical protein
VAVTRDEALVHVGYEWQMYCSLGAILKGLPEEPDPVRFAILEALVMHARNLIEFCSYESGGDTMRKALDIGDAQGVPKEVEPFFHQVSQHVGHLAGTRVTKASWNFTPVTDYVVARFNALRASGKIPSEWVGDHVLTTRLLDAPAKPAVSGAKPGGPQAQPSNQPPRFVSVPTSAIFPMSLGEFVRVESLDPEKLSEK